MKTTTKLLAIAIGATLTQGCDDDHYYCGEGTVEEQGACLGNGGECGPGTHEQDGQCVLDNDVVVCGEGTTEVDGECVVVTVTGLPPELDSVTSPTPYPSGGLMILRGDNFMLSDSGAMVVTVDDVETTNVQVLSNNYAIADLPVSTVATVTVEISNDLGDDSLDFHYTGLYASEGGGLSSSKTFGPLPVEPQTLDIIDPRTGAVAVVGPITAAAGTVPYSVTGLAFAPDGTLWAVEASDYADEAALLTIDRLTGAATVEAMISVPAVIIDPPPSFGPPPLQTYGAFPDLAFVGDTLYSFSREGDDLVTIDTSTFDVTVVPWDGSCGEGCGLAALDDGNLVLWYNGDVHVIGDDGAAIATLDAEFSEYVTSLTWSNGALYGYGAALYRIDTATGDVLEVGPANNFRDALATPPELDDTPGAVTIPEVPPVLPELAAVKDLLPDLDVSAYEPLAVTRPVRASAALAADDVLPASATLDARGRLGVDLATFAQGQRITLRTEHESRTIERHELAGYRLVENRRGELKLVDADGRRVLRGITAIE